MPKATDRRTDATLTDADGRTEPKAKPKAKDKSKTEPKTRPAARGTGKEKKKPAPKSRERAAKTRKKTPSAGPEGEAEIRPAARKKEKKSRKTEVKKKAADHRRAFLLKRAERKSGKKRGRKGKKGLPILWVIILVLALWMLVGAVICIAPAVLDRLSHRWEEVPDWVDVQIIEVNGHARRGVPLDGVHDIVIHYVGNPGTSAQENHDFFAQPDTRVSAHFLVGLEGEIIQCIPLDEKSSASNNRNHDTISIEVCHPGRDGSFNDSTYWSLVKLTVWLCDVYRLSPDHVIRHYDVTGKKCPLYYVDHPEAWERFIEDVTYALDQ